MKWSGLIAVGAVFLSQVSHASLDRRLWIIEQVAQAPVFTGTGVVPTQASLHTTNYGDAISTQASFTASFSWFELVAKGSTRFYTLLTEEGRGFKDANRDSRTVVSFGVGRSYISRHRNFGRLALEVVEFRPALWRFLRIGANTGIFADNDMFFRGNLSFFRKIASIDETDKESNLYLASMEIGRELASGGNAGWKLGGFLGWTYRTRDEGYSTPGRVEHMLFTMGPFAEYYSGILNVRFTLNGRLWLDRELYTTTPLPPIPPESVTAYPQEFAMSDISVVLGLVF